MLINGAVGFAMMVTILYCLGTDIDGVLGSATGYPFIQIFFNSTGNVAGATLMSVLVLVLTWICATGITTTASRMTWSFARDKGFPGSHFIAKVSPRNKIPVVAVLIVTTLAALLTLIYIGSYTAFNDVVSLTITGFYGSYLLPAAFLLYHRLKGHVLPHGSDFGESQSDEQSSDPTMPKNQVQDRPFATGPADAVIEIAAAPLVWGPWHIPGLLGTLNNIYACMYMVFVIFFSVWPPETPVDASTMNYSIVVTGGVMILSAIWYFIRGKKQYKGPTIDTEVASVMRRGSIVEVHQ